MDQTPATLTWPELAMVAITRVLLGAGIGLLLARRLSDERRAAAGWALLLVGVVTTVPLIIEVFESKTPLPTSSTEERPA